MQQDDSVCLPNRNLHSRPAGGSVLVPGAQYKSIHLMDDFKNNNLQVGSTTTQLALTLKCVFQLNNSFLKLELHCFLTSCPCSWWPHRRQPAAGSPACGGPCHLLQVRLVGFPGEGDYGLCRRRWSRVWMQCEFKNLPLNH